MWSLVPGAALKEKTQPVFRGITVEAFLKLWGFSYSDQIEAKLTCQTT